MRYKWPEVGCAKWSETDLPREWYHLLSGNLIALLGRDNSLWCGWSVAQ